MKNSPGEKNDGGWNPYLAGALSGLVSVISVGGSGQYLVVAGIFLFRFFERKNL